MNKRVGITYRRDDKIEPYKKALEAVGLEPVPISPEDPKSLEGLDGLLLSGGTDVDPALYGEDAHPETDEPDRERDAMETDLLKQALDQDLPVLAICRGMQLFNVAHGGTLVQHLEDRGRHRVKQGEPVHEVTAEAGSRVAEIFGEEPVAVNSRHHQAVGVLGEGLVVTARDAEDGMVEAVERPDRRFAVAVQWHPEDQAASDPVQRRLFEKFAESL